MDNKIGNHLYEEKESVDSYFELCSFISEVIFDFFDSSIYPIFNESEAISNLSLFLYNHELYKKLDDKDAINTLLDLRDDDFSY